MLKLKMSYGRNESYIGNPPKSLGEPTASENTALVTAAPPPPKMRPQYFVVIYLELPQWKKDIPLLKPYVLSGDRSYTPLPSNEGTE